MAEEKKPDVNVNEDGTPMKYGDEGYLIGGKYKTMEEAEKGIVNFDKKITEVSQAKADRDKAFTKLQDTIVKSRGDVKKVEDTEQEKLNASERKANAKELADAYEKGPEAALEAINNIVDRRFKKVDFDYIKRSDVDKQSAEDKTQLKELNRIRGTGEDAKLFDALKPEMSKLWEKLPKEAQVTDMIENVFLAAKGKSDIVAIKAKIVSDAAGGTSPQSSSRIKGEGGTKESKEFADTLAAHKAQEVSL